MPKEIEFLKDIAIIMATAGAVMVLFRLLRQPPILGYLIAGVITGPFMPIPLVKDVEIIKLLGELGAVLLLFGVGLEFSWSKIRKMGGVSIIIALIEIPGLYFIGFQLGSLLGLPTLDSLFLGAAISVSSSAIIVKTLIDQGKEHLMSSRIVMGVLVLEDFAAVAMIAILSGIVSTGHLDLQGTTFLLARLALFTLVLLALGKWLVHNIIDYVHRLGSQESLLLVSLGLCFGVALLSGYLGLSAAVGAFLIGSVIGDCRHSGEISELTRPLRDTFSALFFVAMGMLIDIGAIRQFFFPTLLLSFLFIAGNLVLNSVATFLTGYGGKTPIRVGATMTQMGEFSLFIGKVARDSAAASSFIFPAIAATTTITSFTMPHLLNKADAITEWTVRTAPAGLKKYVSILSGWLEALRLSFSQPSDYANRIRRDVIIILSNLAITSLIFQTGAWATQFVEKLSVSQSMSPVLVRNLLGFSTLALCLPSIIIIWGRLRSLAGLVTKSIFSSPRAMKRTKRPFLAVTFRESIMILVLIALALPATSWVIKSFSLGWYPALAVPLLFMAALGYLLWEALEGLRKRMEDAFAATLDGEEHAKPGAGKEEVDKERY